MSNIFTHDVAIRAYKTFIEVTAAQAALYGGLVPDAPPVQTSAAVSVAATVAAVLWNLALHWFTKTKDARLDKLAEAIDKIVDARLAEQGASDPQPTPPDGLQPTVVAP